MHITWLRACSMPRKKKVTPAKAAAAAAVAETPADNGDKEAAEEPTETVSHSEPGGVGETEKVHLGAGGDTAADSGIDSAGSNEKVEAATGGEAADGETLIVGSKRSASEDGDGDAEVDTGVPERPRRRQKGNGDAVPDAAEAACDDQDESKDESGAAPAAASAPAAAGTPSRKKGDGPQRREGDWDCPRCGINCFESKTACFKCHTPRPGYENKQKPRLVLPSGWLDCAAVGDAIATPGFGAGFLPMKVPLSEDYSNEKLCQTPVKDEAKLHTPKGFLSQQNAAGRKVGMVVDLTFTHKYYDGKKEFEEAGIEYLKIMTQGGGTEPPKKPDLDQFAAKVTDFFKNRPEELCAVHCTHGINRSGFFIVTFLVEHCKLELEAALQAFAASRAPGIWDHVLIDQLYKHHGDGKKPGPDAYPVVSACCAFARVLACVCVSVGLAHAKLFTHLLSNFHPDPTME